MNRKRILLFAPYGLWTVHHQLDVVIGKALQMRGAEVMAACCDGIFDCCPIAIGSKTKDDCKRCQVTIRSFFDSAQIPVMMLGSLLRKGERLKIRKWVECIKAEQLPDVEYEGNEIGRWVSPGVHSIMTSSSHDMGDAEVEKIYREFVFNGALVERSMKRLIENYKPDAMICFSGMHVPYRAAFMLARKNGIKTLVHERGTYDDSFLLLENNTLLMSESRIHSWKEWKNIPLNLKQLEWVHEYVENREKGKNINWHSAYNCSSDEVQVRKILRISNDKKLIVIFPCSDWEYGIGKDDFKFTFNSQIEGIQKIIDSLPPEKYDIAIRLHPPMGFTHLEYGKSFLEKMFEFGMTLPENVRLISPLEEITSYALLWNADASITFGSTVSLEGLFKGVGTASNISNVNSAVIEWIKSGEQYDAIVERLVKQTNEFSLDHLITAYRAMFHLHNRVNFKFKSFGIYKHHQADIRIKSWEQIMEECDPALDQVCRHILNNEPLYSRPSIDEYNQNNENEKHFVMLELNKIRDKRKKIYNATKYLKIEEPCVSIVRVRQNGIFRKNSSRFAQSLKRSRYKNIEWQSKFEIALPQEFKSNEFKNELESAICQSQGKYILLGFDFFQIDEALISTAIDYLEAYENRNVDGILSGAWICDAEGKAIGEIFGKDEKSANFAKIIKDFKVFDNQGCLLGLFIYRKSAWNKICSSITASSILPVNLNEYLFMLMNGDDAVVNIHKVKVPLIVIHTPITGKALMEQGIRCGSDKEWEKALIFFQRSLDTGYFSQELDFWHAACLARIGKKWESAILSSNIIVDQTIQKEQHKEVLKILATQVNANEMRYEDIESSVNEIEGWLVDGQEKYLFNKVKSLPDGATILEIGSCYGRSTAAMAFACFGTQKRIFSIDTYLGNINGGSRVKGNCFFDVWKRNIQRRGLEKYVTPLTGYSHEKLSSWNPEHGVDFVFIDASHLFKDVLRDLELVYNLVKNGGWIALHDVDPSWPGPWRVWREICLETLSSHEYATTIACGKKEKGVKLKRPADIEWYNYSREWALYLSAMVPNIAEAMTATFDMDSEKYQRSLKAIEYIIASMPHHPLLRIALREMIQLEASCDPYLHYWNALTYLHDNKNEEAIEEIQKAIANNPTSGLQKRLTEMLKEHSIDREIIETGRFNRTEKSKKPKIVFVNTYYQKFLKSHYQRRPEADTAPYATQLDLLIQTRFGDSDFYSEGMRHTGWRADDLIINCEPLQTSWAKENGFGGQGLEIVIEQIRMLNPDVVYIQDLSVATHAFLAAIRPLTKLIVGQIASLLPSNTDTQGFDIIISSFPHFVERFRKAGITSYYQPLAFDPRVLNSIDKNDKVHDVTFIGGLSTAHGNGLKVLQEVALSVPIDFWGYGAEDLPDGSSIRNRHHGEAWGLDMFNLMARSRITLNRHIDVAENYANNMRLFEATGCGALLITDYRDNLNELFQIGKEIVAFRTPEECIALVQYYQQNPLEAAAIARNGQQRTLREHTYDLRMQKTAEILERHLHYGQHPLPKPNLNEISCGYQKIQSVQVTEEMTKAWKDSTIPIKQRSLVQQELMEMYSGFPPIVYQVLVEALRPICKKNSSILEIGCASGYYYEVIEYLLNQNLSYTGVDYSKPLITMAKKYYPKPAFHVADGVCLPFKNNEFDVAVSSGILLHVPNYDEHIAETARVAKSHVVFHRMPVCRQRSTQYLKKKAYGVETVELRFNEKEIITQILDQGLKIKKYIEYSSDKSNDEYEATYIFEKKHVPLSAENRNEYRTQRAGSRSRVSCPI